MISNLFGGVLRRHFGEDKEYYKLFYDMFGFTPFNIDLYKLALIHKSASLVLDDGSHINNDRLEYLGDAIIEAVTSDYLFIEYTDESEGFLTQMRSRIVSRQSLNGLSRALGLSNLVVANTSSSLTSKDIDGDTFEAIIGAIYLDMGYDFVNRLLINDIYPKYLDLDNLLAKETDFKSRLIEWAQKRHLTISFKTEADSQERASKPKFQSRVYIGGVSVGYGQGESKKEAEQSAAQSVSLGGLSDRDSDELLERMDRYMQNHQQPIDETISSNNTSEQ